MLSYGRVLRGMKRYPSWRMGNRWVCPSTNVGGQTKTRVQMERTKWFLWSFVFSQVQSRIKANGSPRPAALKLGPPWYWSFPCTKPMKWELPASLWLLTALGYIAAQVLCAISGNLLVALVHGKLESVLHTAAGQNHYVHRFNITFSIT